jgi:hypothetical protein
MNFSKDFLNEATAAEINRAGAKELTKIRKEAKQDKKDKKDTGWYQKQQEKNLEYKRERLEWQKERSKLKDKLRKERESEKSGKGITDPIRSIKTQTISDKDKDPTAYRKAIETGYDTAVGVGQAAINALRKKRDDKKKEEEKKDKSNKSKEKSPTRRVGNNLNGKPKPKLLSPAKVKGLLPSTTTGQMARKSPEFKKKEIERRGGTTTPPKPDFKSSEFDKKKSTNEEYSCWREEFLYELGDMRRKKKNSKGGEDYIVDVMPEKKTNTIIMNPTIKEKYLYERKRDNLANALLGLAFATNVAQSPEALVRSGNIEGPGMQLMSRMMQRRKEANRNLDSGRVSHPSRNIKKKTKSSEIKESTLDKSKMKCNKPKAQAVGDSLTGKSHVVKACEGGKEQLLRFGQRGVKGSPKKKGESKEYASRRRRFQSRHSRNIAKGKMSAAYWANKVKW